MQEELPAGFIERMARQDYINLPELLESLNSAGPVSIRVNSSLPSETRLPEYKRVPWCETGYYLPVRPLFAADPLWHAGSYYVQEASSMFLEQLFKRAGGEEADKRILDLCAAPGGKTTHISSLAGTGSLIIANETIAARSSVLAENVTRWGTGNVVVTRNDPSAFTSLENYFDIVVADVPCSGEGMFRSPTVRTQWSESNCQLCADRQKRILSAAWPAIKPGGYMIYSTCTLNPAENEEMIAWLSKESGAEIIETDITSFPGISAVTLNNQFAGYGLYPWKIGGEGFFISLLRKAGDHHDTRRSHHGKRLQMAKGEAIRVAAAMSRFSADRIIEEAGVVRALHADRAEVELLRSVLRVIKDGTTLFTIKGRDIVPSHQLITSHSFRRQSLPESEVGYREAVTYLRRGSLSPRESTAGGWFVITYRNSPIGAAKSAGGRINNYYPREWALRMTPPEEPTLVI